MFDIKCQILLILPEMMTRFLFILLSLAFLTVSVSGEACSSEELMACMDEVLGKFLLKGSN